MDRQQTKKEHVIGAAVLSTDVSLKSYYYPIFKTRNI